MKLLKELTRFLQEGRRNKLAILCIGNALKGDDALGPIIAKRFKNRISSEIILYDVGSQPENFISILRRNDVSHCLIIDAVEFKGEPGDIGFFSPPDLKDIKMIFSTHFLSMKIFLDFIARETNIKLRILGIQPLTLEFGKGISYPVKVALENIMNLLQSHLV
ncbi:MAG: hydrogenase maturation protease [Candidatus Hodarchaeota archaeon]